MRKSFRTSALAAASLVLLLQGCAGGDEAAGIPPICDAIGGSGSTVTHQATPGAGFTEPTAAFDGRLSTHTWLEVTGTGTGTVRGTLAEGQEIAAGPYAGLALDPPEQGSMNVTVTTYLDGVPQESLNAGYTQDGGSQVCLGSCFSREGVHFIGMDTRLPFDAIEATIHWAADTPLPIRELCVSDGFSL